MKRVGILTINDNNNYGNRLQNYATQEAIKKVGGNPETIMNNILLYESKNDFKKYIKNILKRFSKNNRHRRYLNFIDFNKNIIFSKYNIEKINENIDNKYDYFITGSDQVWNPKFNRLTDIDLLKFAKDDKRISFSASFGISELSEEFNEKTKNELLKFKAISVREDAGKKIVEKLTKRDDVEVLVDPTMLLSDNEWDKIAKRPKMLQSEKYILNYFLGDVSEENKKEIERIAKEHNCTIINILDKNSEFYECGPSEFLYLKRMLF